MSLTGCCCSPFQTSATQHFNQKRVAEELTRYRQNGIGPTTRLLVEGLSDAEVFPGTVLDIGAGFGALTYALLERGAPSAVAVDASASYLAAALEEATRQHRNEAVRFVLGDFVTESRDIPPASIVTLDRVVCCYPSFELLLEAALGHAERFLALSYPRNVWWVRTAMRAENGRRWLARNPFRTFVHPSDVMEDLITRAGFILANRRTTGMWSVDVYGRHDDSLVSSNRTRRAGLA
jgi:magnesium-protoporphyrin O-methyltransferase